MSYPIVLFLVNTKSPNSTFPKLLEHLWKTTMVQLYIMYRLIYAYVHFLISMKTIFVSFCLDFLKPIG